MKKNFFLLFTTSLLFFVACTKNFDQDTYFKKLIGEGFKEEEHPEKLPYLAKRTGIFTKTDFLIIKSNSNLDEVFQYNIKSFEALGYKMILDQKNYKEFLNGFGIKALILKDKDCVLITTGSSDEYAKIKNDLLIGTGVN